MISAEPTAFAAIASDTTESVAKCSAAMALSAILVPSTASAPIFAMRVRNHFSLVVTLPSASFASITAALAITNETIWSS